MKQLKLRFLTTCSPKFGKYIFLVILFLILSRQSFAQCAACSAGSMTCTGVISITDPVATSRAEVDGVPSTCGTSSCNNTFAGTFYYDKYSFTNTTASTVCYTVTINNNLSCGITLFSAVYSSFSPGSGCATNIGDLGSGASAGTSGSYSFNIPAGQCFEVIVHNRTTAQFCSGGSYTMTLSPCATVGACPTTSATKVVFVQDPTNTLVDQTISPAVTVQLQNNASVNVTDPNIPITLTLTSGNGILLGTLTKLTNASGLATFSDLSLDVVGSNRQLTAASGALTPDLSNLFNVTAPATVPCNACSAGSITCSGQLIKHGTETSTRKDVDGSISTCANNTVCSATAGIYNYLKYSYTNTSGASQCYTVTINNACDAAGTTLYSAAYSPTFNPVSVCTNVLGDLGNATGTTNSYQFTVANGQSFEIVVWNRSINFYCSSPFTMTLSPCATPGTWPGTSATKVVFVQDPTNTVVDQTISPAVTVQLKNNADVNVTDPNIPITLTLTSGSGSLLGTLTQNTNASGLATFSNLSMDVVGSNKQITASYSSLTPDLSNLFNITAPATVPCNTCSAGSISCTGQLIKHGTETTTRKDVDGTISTCANNTACVANAGIYNYLKYSYTNTTGASQCFTITIDNACNAAGSTLYSAAYSPSFNPANVCTNILGDLGNATGTTNSYQFTVGNGISFEIVVWNRSSNSYCSSPYTLTLSPCPCATVTGTVSGGGTICAGNSAPVTVTFTGGVAPYTFTLNNGGGTATGPSPLTKNVSSTVYGLSSAVCKNRLDYITKFVTELHVGSVNVREVPGYRLELTPFGGIKDSGLGYKEGVLEAMKSFTNVKTYSLPWPA